MTRELLADVRALGWIVLLVIAVRAAYDPVLQLPAQTRAAPAAPS